MKTAPAPLFDRKPGVGYTGRKSNIGSEVKSGFTDLPCLSVA